MRPAYTWLIADTHLNHDAICRPDFENRPLDHGERVRKSCRNLVAPQDTLIHLGDVIFYHADDLYGWLSSIPARAKILVRGNHDKGHSDSWFLDRGFDAVCDGMIYKGCLLTHAPVRDHGFPLNIHGHWHSMPDVPEWYDLARYFRVSLEWQNYAPVRFDEIPQTQNPRCKSLPGCWRPYDNLPADL